MGARIYNLLPTLAGPVARWTGHLDRIAAMRFDWVFVNPFHAPGGSGSLYAVADYYRLNPFLRDGATADDDTLLRDFAAAAGARDLSVMMDLVINHTANDGNLVAERPHWYRRDPSGLVVAPSAVDPDDASKVTVWGDLAELDYRPRPERAELVAYFVDVACHYARLGIGGFRCDAAYQVPGDVWSDIIAAVRAVRADAFFAAETLGCTLDQVAQLDGAGFDALFNSSKWWDFEAPWLLDQYNAFRHIAPSIAFPESHDTPRLAAELAERPAAEIEAEYRFRYLFAATFSSGVMMPMGYEFGFSRAFDVVRTRPEDWETPRFDISTYIAEINALKATVPALGIEGAERRIELGDDAPVALLREGGAQSGDVLTLLNPHAHQARAVELADVERALGSPAKEITPQHPRNLPDSSDKRRRPDRPVRFAARSRAESEGLREAQSSGFAGVNGRIEIHPLSARIFVRESTTATSPASPAQPEGKGRKKAQARDARADARIVVIERVRPQLDEGRHPVKRVVGDRVDVTADVFREGHDAVEGVVLYRERGAPAWREAPLRYVDNDAWTGSFTVERVAHYEYTLEAWPDHYGSWHHDTALKHDAKQTIGLELLEGRQLIDEARARATGAVGRRFAALVRELETASDDAARAGIMFAPKTLGLVRSAPDRRAATRYAPALGIICERRAAAFAAWYEMFPRSQGTEPGAHGTFADAEKRLPAIRAMGFDVVYLPPIHPIGHAFRKGKNNTLEVTPEDPGSPWAIGNQDGGHTAIEPRLGTFEDFGRFVAAARANGLEVALDYALQSSPDHPYLKEHPQWFTRRPDGTIKYAENPPKKYQDIVNFNWYGPHATALWDELRDVVEFWIARGVTTFRVDNPHTKPFAFWAWMIADVQSRHPETIFLAEAFTRPKVMNELAKLGFTQSYTYFTWRNTKDELTEYLTELTKTEMAEFYRPNFFANTPDILPLFLQSGGRAAFRIRLVLAATLSSVYGIYSGFELCENVALPHREEYLDSEKYEIRVRDWNAPGNIVADVARINRVRRENRALQDWRNVRFYRADDDAVLFYGKVSGDNLIFVAVNLDPFVARETTLWFPTGELGLADDDPYAVEELLDGRASAQWRGSPHGVRLDPQQNPAAIYRLRIPSAR